jgi:hypothetical protein
MRLHIQVGYEADSKDVKADRRPVSISCGNGTIVLDESSGAAVFDVKSTTLSFSGLEIHEQHDEQENVKLRPAALEAPKK